MTKLVDAILRGPSPYFGKDAVLYMPGQIVRDVPAEEVSDENCRQEVVEIRGDDGKVRQTKVQRQIKFRPLPAGGSPRRVPADEPTG